MTTDPPRDGEARAAQTHELRKAAAESDHDFCVLLEEKRYVENEVENLRAELARARQGAAFRDEIRAIYDITCEAFRELGVVHPFPPPGQLTGRRYLFRIQEIVSPIVTALPAPPAPQEEPGRDAGLDVFRAVAEDWKATIPIAILPSEIDRIAALLRERFGLLVELAESVEDCPELDKAQRQMATDALDALRGSSSRSARGGGA